jgi:hypothetical protein
MNFPVYNDKKPQHLPFDGWLFRGIFAHSAHSEGIHLSHFNLFAFLFLRLIARRGLSQGNKQQADHQQHKGKRSPGGHRSY